MKALRYFLLCRAKRNAGELIFLTLMFIFSASYIAKSQYPFFEMYLGLRSLSLFAAMKVWQSGPVGFSPEETANIYNAPIDRKIVAAFGVLKTHSYSIGLFLVCAISFVFRIAGSCGSGGMILFLSAVAFNAGITLAISYFLTKIRLESKAKAAMILVVYFSEIACEALLLTFFRNEIRTFLAKTGFEPVFFASIIFGILAALSAVFLFVFRKKFSLAIERSFFPEAYISKRDEKKQSKGEWKDSRNYMINKTILAESREKGLFFDPGLIIGTAFSIMMSVAWSQTTDKDGNLLSSVEILGMSVTVYAFFLGALFENKTLQQELSFDFLKLVPEKWHRKLLNILAIPFAKAAIYVLIAISAFEYISKASFSLLLVMFMLEMSYVLVFFGMYIFLFRITAKYEKIGNIAITYARMACVML